MTTDQTLYALVAAVTVLAAVGAGAVALARPRLGPALMVAATVGGAMVVFLRPA